MGWKDPRDEFFPKGQDFSMCLSSRLPEETSCHIGSVNCEGPIVQPNEQDFSLCVYHMRSTGFGGELPKRASESDGIYHVRVQIDQRAFHKGQTEGYIEGDNSEVALILALEELQERGILRIDLDKVPEGLTQEEMAFKPIPDSDNSRLIAEMISSVFDNPGLHMYRMHFRNMSGTNYVCHRFAEHEYDAIVTAREDNGILDLYCLVEIKEVSQEDRNRYHKESLEMNKGELSMNGTNPRTIWPWNEVITEEMMQEIHQSAVHSNLSLADNLHNLVGNCKIEFPRKECEGLGWDLEPDLSDQLEEALRRLEEIPDAVEYTFFYLWEVGEGMGKVFAMTIGEAVLQAREVLDRNFKHYTLVSCALSEWLEDFTDDNDEDGPIVFPNV